jgi:glycosyltransferase involved in cell wall biosynthesis
MRLLIQINCLNEKSHIGPLLQKIPRKIKGINKVEILVIDDGSSDNTHIEAKENGADYVLRNFGNKGIPFSLNRGLQFAREHGYDLLINMDADDQHDVHDIPKLLQPILDFQADIVHGERPLHKIGYNGGLKKFFRWLGSSVVSWLVGLKLIDASSGFRAINKDAISKIFLLYDYQEPLEYIMQAGKKGLNVKTVEINPKPSVRPSRLFNSLLRYIWRSTLIIIDNAIVYRATGLFLFFGLISTVIGIGVFLYRAYLVNTYGSENLYLTQLLVAVIGVTVGIQLVLFSFISRILRANRIISEETMSRVR